VAWLNTWTAFCGCGWETAWLVAAKREVQVVGLFVQHVQQPNGSLVRAHHARIALLCWLYYVVLHSLALPMLIAIAHSHNQVIITHDADSPCRRWCCLLHWMLLLAWGWI
jgi:hypothetical protein